MQPAVTSVNRGKGNVVIKIVDSIINNRNCHRRRNEQMYAFFSAVISGRKGIYRDPVSEVPFLRDPTE
jgi:hypothetical protein